MNNYYNQFFDVAPPLIGGLTAWVLISHQFGRADIAEELVCAVEHIERALQLLNEDDDGG